jgi:hypothetical protein
MLPTPDQTATAESLPQPARWTLMVGHTLVVQDAHGDTHHIPGTERGTVSKGGLAVNWSASIEKVEVMPTNGQASVSTLTPAEARTLAHLLLEAVRHGEDERDYLRAR